jgi:hypothetical protein
LDRFRFLLVLSLALACEAPTLSPRSERPPPRITSADVPPPAIVGSTIRITGTDLDRLGSVPTLSVGLGGGFDVVLSLVPASDRALHFEVSRDLVERLGAGTHAVTLVAEGAGVRTAERALSLEIATALPIALDEGLSGDVHRNDLVVLDGDGFLTPGEGTLVASVVGTFTPDAGAPVAIDAEVPVDLADRTSRSRGVVLLTTALGGNRTGTLDGTITLRSAPRTLATSESDAMPVAIRFVAPDLYAFDPAAAALGRIVRLRGAGFLGGAGDETTLVRIEGTFTPLGGAASPWSMELVPVFESGASAALVIETRVDSGALVASLFGSTRGTLEGTATPITIAGTEELTGLAAPFRFTLESPHQVVLLTFLPGYYDSLARFGLAAAEEEIETRIVERIHRIFSGYHVDVVTEPPDDWDERHYARVEIGGPDPNGNGLFGYDNSPGKDVGNLRLFDRLGGENAETQEDGFPGYGGVFVESLLWWSSHPDLPSERPPSSPPADALFDEMFDPVRLQPVTAAELAGDATSERLDAIDRAIRALSSIIGETTAHELGHSLGLAQPFGAPTVFHNDSDGDGCLMDRGGDRPLGERAEEPGYVATRLCYDEPEYLAALLGD